MKPRERVMKFWNNVKMPKILKFNAQLNFNEHVKSKLSKHRLYNPMYQTFLTSNLKLSRSNGGIIARPFKLFIRHARYIGWYRRCV